jgi:hypothetical protein
MWDCLWLVLLPETLVHGGAPGEGGAGCEVSARQTAPTLAAQAPAYGGVHAGRVQARLAAHCIAWPITAQPIRGGLKEGQFVDQ